MKGKYLLLSFVILFLLANCKKNDPNAKVTTETDKKISGEIVLSGAYALMPVALNWASEFQKMYPSVKVKVYIKGTGEGIKDLIDGKANLAMISRDPEPNENSGLLWKLPVARDGVGLIVNSKNPYLEEILKRGFKQAELVKIFTFDKPNKWKDYFDNAKDEPINVYVRSDKSGAASVWANFLFCKEEDLKGTKCDGDPAIIEAISKDILGFSFSNLNYAFDDRTLELNPNLRIIPIDLNNNGKIDSKEELANNLIDFERNVWAGKYPKCLCRYLHLATLTKPTNPAIIEFLNFTQTKGQEIVSQSGLCKLNTIELENNLLLLK